MENQLTLIEAHKKRVDGMNEALDLGPNASALDLLQAIYRNSGQELHTRMRAAMAAIAYETPKLAVTAVVQENDIATALDRRIARLNEMKLVEPNGEPVITQPIAEPMPTSIPTLPSPLSRIYTNRFRRRF
jgi:hypothetical protein